LARGDPAVVAFVNDRLYAEALELLRRQGTGLVALRSAGFNNVDLSAAQRLGLAVVRVPSYSPHCVAEHVFALLLALARHIPQADTRVRDGNFGVERLVGFVLARLLTFQNVLITSHMGFLIREALADIAQTTLASLSAFGRHEPLANEVGPEQFAAPPPHESVTQAVPRTSRI
jgi:lactate dehydrogenase-like 2-hydroxyacid dehydrogenase